MSAKAPKKHIAYAFIFQQAKKSSLQAALFSVKGC